MERFTHRPEKEPEQDAIPDQERIVSIQDTLEVCAKNNEEIHILEEALTSSPKALSELYDRVAKKYKTFIGALLFAVVSHTTEARSLPEDLKTQIIQLEQSINTMGNEIIEKNTGIDFIKEAEKIGRNATFYISENKSSLVIAHFGQRHATTEKANYDYRYDIAKSQTEIATILLNTTNSSTGVFLEGFTQKTDTLLDKAKVASARLKGAGDVNELKRIYKEECEKIPHTIAAAILNKIAGDKLISFGFTETSPLVFTDTQEIFVLLPTGIFPVENSYTVPNNTESNIVGAAEILDAEGQIDVYPAETSEGNSKSSQLRDTLKVKGEILGNMIVSLDFSNLDYQYFHKKILPTLSESEYSAEQIKDIAQSETCVKSAECQKIVAEILYEDIPSIRKAVIDDREDIAIELIAKHAETSDQTYFPLVYGNLHDFTRAVKKWNAEHPGLQFNLVTVK